MALLVADVIDFIQEKDAPEKTRRAMYLMAEQLLSLANDDDAWEDQ